MSEVLSEASDMSRKFYELELRVLEQDETIYALEKSVSQRDAARIKAFEDLLKARARKIEDLESEIRSKDYEINDLESDLDRQKHEDDGLQAERKVRLAIEVVAMREIIAALPDPARETYDQFMFRRNLRILFAALGVDVSP